MEKLLLFLLKRYVNKLSKQQDKLAHYIAYENYQIIQDMDMLEAYKYLNKKIKIIYKTIKIIRGDYDA